MKGFEWKCPERSCTIRFTADAYTQQACERLVAAITEHQRASGHLKDLSGEAIGGAVRAMLTNIEREERR